MPRASKSQSEETGRRIVTEAWALFAAHGYAAIGLEQVASAADVTRGAVYHHFGSKRGLFEAVASAAQEKVADAVVATADAETDDWRGLVAGCRAFLSASVSGDTRQVLLIDAPAVLGWQTWRTQDAAASGHHLVEAIATLVEQGAVRVASVEGMAALLSGAMNEAALQIAGSDDPDAALASVTQDLERLLDGLRAR